MSVRVSRKCDNMILAKVEKKPKKLPPYGKIETAAGCHSFAAASGLDGSTFAKA